MQIARFVSNSTLSKIDGFISRRLCAHLLDGICTEYSKEHESRKYLMAMHQESRTR